MEPDIDALHTRLRIDKGKLQVPEASAPPSLLPSVLGRLGLGMEQASPSASIEKLIVSLTDSDWQVRIAAVRTLEHMGMNAPVEPLLSALQDDDASVRAAAVHALAQLGARVPIHYLIKALRDPDWHVRETAALMLSRLGQDIPVEPVQEMLHDTDSAVQEAARLSLQRRQEVEHHTSASGLPVRNEDIARQATDRLPGSDNISSLPLSAKPSLIKKTENTGEHMQYALYTDTQSITKNTSHKKRMASGLLFVACLAFIVVIGSVFLNVSRGHNVQHGSSPNAGQGPGTLTSSTPTPTPTPAGPIGKTLYTFRGHQAAITALAWSPDSQRVASSSNDDTLQIWDATTGHHLLNIHENTQINTLAWSPNGKYLVLANAFGLVQIRDASTGAVLHTFHIQLYSTMPAHIGAIARTSGGNTVRQVVWSPDGTQLALATGGGYLITLDAQTGRILTDFQADTRSLATLSWSPDGKYIAAAGHDAAIKVWNAEQNYSLGYFLALNQLSATNYIASIAWSHNGKELAFGTTDGILQTWNPFTNTSKAYHGQHTQAMYSLSWSPDDTRFVVADTAGFSRIWNVATAKPMYTYADNGKEVIAVAWSPDGSMIASGDWDNTDPTYGLVNVWKAN